MDGLNLKANKMGNAPILWLNKQANNSCDRFVKLNNYVNSNKRLTKMELKKLLDDLKKPLFALREGLNPSEEFIDFGDL
jgi:hypothetical protein